jgi:hypothetical protein
VAPKVGTNPLTALLKASLRITVIVEADIPSAPVGLVPVMEELAATGMPAVKITVPPSFTTGEVSERILDSARVDAKVQLDKPVALVAVHEP